MLICLMMLEVYTNKPLIFLIQDLIMRKRKFSKKKHRNNDYYNRELLLNKKIRQFQNEYYNLSNPPLPSEYRRMDALRKDIKHLFRCQEYQVWQKSFNRKHAYFSQLTLFKSIYMMWKRFTFFIYIEIYFDVPHHIAQWAKIIGANMVPNGVFGT